MTAAPTRTMDAPIERPPLRVVFLTHVFPRHPLDPLGAFLLHLAAALAPRAAMEVVAPHAPSLADAETVDAIAVQRFHYAPARWERLAYSGAMHDLVARRWDNQILFLLFNLAFWVQAVATIRARRAQLIHAHWWLPAGLIGALAAIVTRVPLIVTTHGTDVEQLRRARWARSLARFVFARAAAITCGSQYTRAQLLELGVAAPQRVRVIPMPVNPLFVKFQVPSSNHASRLTHHEFTILTVARLSAQKSIDTLIDALGLVRARGVNARLTIVGDGDQRAVLEQQARALNLHSHVEFCGARAQTELPRYYAGCDVFVLPSIREGMGLVLAEALLCGAPVIAVNSGGVTDIVRDGETGLLVPPRDAAALTAALESIRNDRALAERLATNGGAWVRARFAPERVAAQFLEVYRQSLGLVDELHA